MMVATTDPSGFKAITLPASYVSLGGYRLVSTSSSSTSDNGLIPKVIRDSGSSFRVVLVQTIAPGGYASAAVDLLAIGFWY